MILAILIGFGVSTGIVLISISILSLVLQIPYSDAFLAIIVTIHAILASLIGHNHYQAYAVIKQIVIIILFILFF